MQVKIYTDGSCSGNPGPGGWGCVLMYGASEKRLKGGLPNTTNNQMELQATIEGLRALNRPCDVTIVTDSQYVKKGITQWIHGWLKNNWQTASKKPVKNKDQWLELHSLCQKHTVQWEWVKGHNGDYYNEIADQLACEGTEEMKEGGVI